MTTPVVSVQSDGASAVTGDGTVYQLVCATVLLNTTSNYNSSTGVFTAGEAGSYEFSYHIGMEHLTSGHSGYIKVESTNKNLYFNAGKWGAQRDAQNKLGISSTFILPMAEGATLVIKVVGVNGTKVVDITTDTVFCAHQII